MSFVSYKYLRSLGYDEKTNIYSYEYEITDSEWIDPVVAGEVGLWVAYGVSAGVAVGDAVINAYEKRELPVAPNLALAFQYIAKQYGWTIEQAINWNKKKQSEILKIRARSSKIFDFTLKLPAQTKASFNEYSDSPHTQNS